MPLTLVPTSFSDLLLIAKSAHCLAWHRESQILDIICDAHDIDRRTCISFRFKSLRGSLRRLSGYNPQKNAWGAYCGAEQEMVFADRRGQKAFAAWLAERALAQTGCENPSCLSIFQVSPAPIAVAA